MTKAKEKKQQGFFFLVNHPWKLNDSAFPGHSGAVAQSRSWLGPWQDALNSDGAAMDGSEESGWVELWRWALYPTSQHHVLSTPSHAFSLVVSFLSVTLCSRSFPRGEAGTVVSSQFILPSRQPVHAGCASWQCRWTRYVAHAHFPL